MNGEHSEVVDSVNQAESNAAAVGSPNERAYQLVQRMLARAAQLRVAEQSGADGTIVVDCGVQAHGGLEAGLLLARVCLGDLATVRLVRLPLGDASVPHVQVDSDWPVLACMGCQYAGWQIERDDYFAMGSGPMRLLAQKEELLAKLTLRDRAERAVGVLEAGKLPPEQVIRYIADESGVPPRQLVLLVARTASMAGTVQVVARSVETCLHKMYELGFDLHGVRSASGVAPIPPPGADDLEAIGRTNDAILYGAQVTLWTDYPDDLLEERGPDVPSCSSSDFGLLFRELFDKAGGNFYDIDPMIFSPAQVTFYNRSGRMFTFGQVYPDVCWHSFRTH